MAKGPDIAGAEKKLRQAEFFFRYLEHTSEEMVNDVARGVGDSERLEFFFSACLSAAQSVYYVLEKTGGAKFRDLQKKWRKGLMNNSRGIGFGKMITLRGNDVHLGTTGATPLPKYVQQDHRWNQHAYQPLPHYNVALFGDAPVIEEVNPDGKKVTGSILRGTVGLYLDHHGLPLEATTVCRDFIDRLRSLLEATKSAFPP